MNLDAIIIDAASPIYVDNYSEIQGKRVLVIEDGPTLTHGGIGYGGAGTVAARKFGAREIVDARPYAIGSIREVYENYSHISKVLPAMGYGEKQIKELEESINNIDADLIISGTPIDITRVVNVNKPVLRTKYILQEIGEPELEQVLNKFTIEE